MTVEPEERLIPGLTLEGGTFRPIDWRERICGALAGYAESRLTDSRHARPVSRRGQTGVVVEAVLEELDPAGHDFLTGFARDNRLRVVSGRETIREPQAAGPTP